MKPFRITMFFIMTVLIFSCITGCSSESIHESGDAMSSDKIRTNLSRSPAKDDLYTPGAGLPKGARRDSRGYVVMPGGNTFDHNGGWQIPEGGSIDSKGRILDRNGKLVGGGATIGSKG